MHNTSDVYSRRFGGLTRLYGNNSLNIFANANILVAGIGGVGTWCAEALARSGIGNITLVDMDHISESNINRQLHALSSTIGQSKVNAMSERIYQINPGCRVTIVDDFIEPDNVSSVINSKYNVVIDCTDQLSAKISMINYCHHHGIRLLVCGGAGGKTNPLSLRAGDIAFATHDSLLRKIRNVLRRDYGFPRPTTKSNKNKIPVMGVWTCWFEQQAILPSQWQHERSNPYMVEGATSRSDHGNRLQGLSCAGYGSLISVTASMGMLVASRALELLLHE